MNIKNWREIFKKELEKVLQIEKGIREKIKDTNLEYKILPKNNIFRALELTTLDKARVLIVGQDPYPEIKEEEGEIICRADGLAFSFGDNAKENDSLKNIFDKLREIKDIELETRDLTQWAKRGILLLNTSLTYGKLYDKDKPNMRIPEYKNLQNKIQKQHLNIWQNGIENLIQKIISYKIEQKEPFVIMLWGGHANLLQPFRDDTKDKELENKNILILRSSHPTNSGKQASSYSGNFKTIAKKLKCNPLINPVNPFMKQNHFIICNEYYEKLKHSPIDWSLYKTE